VTAVNATSRWDAADYAGNAAFVPALGAPVVALLDPRPGERILDLGCGDGVLTQRIVAAGASVLGVDASASLRARARAAGLDVAEADGQALAFGPEFDAVFSNAALHWMLNAAAVARGVFSALKPGGRFVGEMGGVGNVESLRAALWQVMAEHGVTAPVDDPQWYPTPDEFTDVYAAAGFAGIEARLIPRPTELPAGIAQWILTFRGGLMSSLGLSPEAQVDIAHAVEARLAPTATRADGVQIADYIRLRFSMRKPA
jgi:SAM-dependent methyltransferase